MTVRAGTRARFDGAAPVMGRDQVAAWLEGLANHPDDDLACAAWTARQCLDQLPLDAAQRAWRRQVELESFKALKAGGCLP